MILFLLGCFLVGPTPNPDDGDKDGFDNADEFCEDDSEDCLNLDCDDNDPKVHPGADEICNEIDDDCDGEVDNDCATPS